MSRFITELKSGLMLGDGGIGTLLYQRGERLNACYDALNLDKPQVVQQVHLDYLESGARLMETNTFGANRLKLEKYRLRKKCAPLTSKESSSPPPSLIPKALLLPVRSGRC